MPPERTVIAASRQVEAAVGSLLVKWDEQRGSLDGRATMLIKRLASAFGWRDRSAQVRRSGRSATSFTHAIRPNCGAHHPARGVSRGARAAAAARSGAPHGRPGQALDVAPRPQARSRAARLFTLAARTEGRGDKNSAASSWPVCQEHGCDKVGVICWSCGGEGYRRAL